MRENNRLWRRGLVLSVFFKIAFYLQGQLCNIIQMDCHIHTHETQFTVLHTFTRIKFMERLGKQDFMRRR